MLPLAVSKHNLNVLFNPGFTAPIFCPCPNVTVFHDLQHKRHPEHFRWFDLPFWRFLLWAAVRRSRALIAVSGATRDDLRRYYGVTAEVIHHGVEPPFFEIAVHRQPRDYLLCVSTLHPHKNLARLIRAHAAAPGMPKLIVTGLKGFAASEIERLAAGNARIELTGWIPREQLYELFRGARAFIYPSMFEGFGMPVLEAMAAGIPVACSNIPPLREIAGDDVFYFDPEDENAMRSAIVRVLSDTSKVDAARRHVAGFTWEKTARETLRVLESQT